MKLSEWAAQQGVHYQTAWRWWKRGTLPVPARQLASGTILVQAQRRRRARRAARSSPRGCLLMTSGRIGIARSARAVVWASAQQLAVDQVVTKIGSGLNGRRPRLARLLTNAQVTTIVVQHRDRLARFGVEHLQAARTATGTPHRRGRRQQDDRRPGRGHGGVLTSFCARRDGRRGARNRALRAVTAAKRST